MISIVAEVEWYGLFAVCLELVITMTFFIMFDISIFIYLIIFFINTHRTVVCGRLKKFNRAYKKSLTINKTICVENRKKCKKKKGYYLDVVCSLQ